MTFVLVQCERDGCTKRHGVQSVKRAHAPYSGPIVSPRRGSDADLSPTGALGTRAEGEGSTPAPRRDSPSAGGASGVREPIASVPAPASGRRSPAER